MNDVDELCDRVAFMADGKIAETNSPKNLKLKHGQRLVEVEYQDGDRVRKDSFDLDQLGKSEEFLDIVKTRHIITMHSKETHLDDIFIKVTGVEVSD